MRREVVEIAGASIMSVTGPKPEDVEAGLLHTAAGQKCFYCGKLTRDPAIHWMGFDSDIFLHPGCCVDLAIRLFRDVNGAMSGESISGSFANVWRRKSNTLSSG